VAKDLCGELVSSDSSDEPPTNYVRTQAAKARQAERIRELTAEGYTVLRGQAGLTVFNFAGAWQK
jgi:hypothetical protein